MMGRPDEELSRLFRAYRDACPDPLPGADFMPGVWRRIEQRRRFSSSLRRWTGAFVTASAALCVALAVYTSSLASAEIPVLTTAFVESLETDTPDTLPYLNLVSPEPDEPVEVE